MSSILGDFKISLLSLLAAVTLHCTSVIVFFDYISNQFAYDYWTYWVWRLLFVQFCIKRYYLFKYWASLVVQMVKHLPTVQETQVRSLGWEDPLEKEIATYSSTPDWKVPWMKEPGRLQSMGSQGVGHDWETSLFFHFHSNISSASPCSPLLKGLKLY